LSPACAEDNVESQINALNWVKSPATVDITSHATVKLEGNVRYLNSVETKKFLKLTQNPELDNRYTIQSPSEGWFAVFSFAPEGYVKDDEKIDADDLLKTLKKGNKESISERKKQGLPVLYLDEWYVPPHYDQTTKRLEWGVKYHDEEGDPVINYTSRILGRNGYVNAILVSEPNTLNRDLASFKASLQSFDYKSGEKYSEFKEGDKIAAYGLGALILGGAAAIATKKGFWGVIVGFLAASWKLVAAAVVAALAGLKALFKKKG